MNDDCPASLAHRPGARLLWRLSLCCLLLSKAGSLPLEAQCWGKIDSPAATARCTARHEPQGESVVLDSGKAYALQELIDIAESNHPRTKQAWERAKQAANRLSIIRGSYYPELVFLAFFGDERIINPFPKPLAPRGYTMAELPRVQPLIGLDYVLYDFGKRGSELDQAKAAQLGAAAGFLRVNQEVAYAVVQAYYGVLTQEQRLTAARQTLSTAKTTEDAAQAQLDQGRATLPDVLNARAARAQAAYDLEAAIGAERIARVALRESLGVEPSDEIQVAVPQEALPSQVADSIQQLVSAALQVRPDLEQLSQRLRAGEAEVRVAQAERRPAIHLQGNIGQTALWPTSSYGQLGAANQTTWNVGATFRWTLFDAGKRNQQLALAQAERRERQEELEEKHDAVIREVWTAYLSFRTAVQQQEAAQYLLHAAQTSYDASFEAYRYGVKNLIDVVTAEKQLAEARYAQVQATASLRSTAVQLEYATGQLLRQRPPLTASAEAQP